MRSIDLALYADALAAEASTLAARLERARGELRRTAIEHEARLALAPELVARLERLGLLATPQASARDGALSELQASLQAVQALQAWVEARLARCGPEPGAPSDPLAGDRDAPDSTPGEDALRKEPAMTT